MSGDVVERLRLGAWEAQRRHGVNPESTVFGKAADLITSQAAKIERLKKERDEARAQPKVYCAMLSTGVCDVIERAETAERLLAEARAALVPSAETKADYIGEFQFTVTMMELDESDEPYECQRMVTVPWTTIKEIMAAISARTLTNGGENGR